MTLAERFDALFAGLRYAYGGYKVVRNTERLKQKGERGTVKQPVTVSVWERHLSSDNGIGIVPLAEDNKISFAAIDIDFYDGDQIENIKRMGQVVSQEGWPFAVCRTKSGGMHLYCFFKVPTNPAPIRKKLDEIAIALGFPGAEVFPKQNAHLDEDSFGNWINMPYVNGAQTDRFCLLNDAPLTPEAFLDYAETLKISGEDFARIKLGKKPKEKDEFDGAPPCLRKLVKDGFPEGSRNNGLFNLAVYARKRYPDNYPDWVDKWNQDFLGPGTPEEVRNAINSVNKVAYDYLCTQDPIQPLCDKDACNHCEYGKDDGGSVGFVINKIIKVDSDPPVYFVDIEGSVIQMAAEVLTHPGRFALRVFERLNFMPPQLKQSRWNRLLNKAMMDADIRSAPRDASPEGQFWGHVSDFCTRRAQARNRAELLQSKPLHDTEEQRHFFRGKDLLEYLKKQGFYEFKQNQVYALLQKDGGERGQWNVKGKHISWWSVPEFDQQTESFDVQVVKDEF